ncbi:MAG: L-aspartate oxidase [Hahellaceae bacterium]|jgi:L-aspartate oxidase|nr:L-aspartate oxidase [Hahellaceae bacterium]
MSNHPPYDVVIIGSGAAGLTVALNLPATLSVAVLSKTVIKSGSTLWAQGGIAAVLGDDDSVESHVKDTLVAGADLCHEDAVRFTVEHSKEAIDWLISQGVSFDLDDSVSETDPRRYHLTREGGHSHRRIIHAADATGQAVLGSLVDQARARANLTLLEDRVAVDLITRQAPSANENRCLGLYVFNEVTGQVEALRARFTVLATGGASKVYLYTSNPDIATGDGIAMAWRAGCRIANMEFNQFHPTCLYHPQAGSFLITEAVRGEGGLLKLPNGERFMHLFDPREELAPRDIVARAIDHEMKRLGADHLLLDISHRDPEFIRQHFPTIYERCLGLGLDITREPIPVVPAAHYTCGGVMTDLNGRTDVECLYAVGETAFTGLHGANRMASNSLLECLVFGRACAEDIAQLSPVIEEPPQLRAWDESQVTDSDEDVVISHNWNELRHFMWDYVGIVRTDKRLQRARNRVELLQQEIRDYYSNYRITPDLLELRNLVDVADLIVRSALMRKESRGLHFTLDYPDLAKQPTDSIVIPTRYVPEAWKHPSHTGKIVP